MLTYAWGAHIGYFSQFQIAEEDLELTALEYVLKTAAPHAADSPALVQASAC
jgi:hypothetical protein